MANDVVTPEVLSRLDDPAWTRSILAAVDKVQGIIEFDLSGQVRWANKAYLDMFGYSLDQVVGKHHRVFCPDHVTRSLTYEDFWRRLGTGRTESGEFLRMTSAGRYIWLQASYNPVHNIAGQLTGVVKFATDITAAKLRNAEMEARMKAIERVQGVIEFDLHGHVVHANRVYLDLMGYDYEEVIGQHHSFFCDPSLTRTSAYQSFWRQLSAGEYHAGEFRRIARNGSPVWIQASYNPVFGPDGKPVKVIKFATDITAEKRRQADITARLEAINRVQGVAEFSLAGHLLDANPQFVQMFGYTRDEVIGQHHRMFCEEAETNDQAYVEFWEKLRQGEFHAGRFRRKSRTGRTVWIQASYNPVLGPSGMPLKVIKFATDITADVRRQAEDADRLGVVDQTLCCAELSRDANVITANHRLLSVLGEHPESVHGMNLKRFLAPSDGLAAEFEQHWASILLGHDFSMDLVLHPHQSDPIRLHAAFRAVDGADGRPGKVLMMAW